MPSRPLSSSTRRFSLELLEDRSMMAGIPVLNSLPGAAQTIYLDFNGDFLATWNRTDSNQTYTNVNVGVFNLDNNLAIGDAESAAIQKIWQAVADDFAPFNVNVTTVDPGNFANGQALRIVMAGQTSATLRTAAGNTFNMNGTVFIGDNNGNAVDTSGYAAIDSYTNGEPNTVYVFARYINTWGNIDSEDRIRDLQYVMATTASHEAGHAFGLFHQGDYDTGSSITTPIMGSNTQGDRSVWSINTTGSTTVNALTHLTNIFGARAGDFSSSYPSASNFPISYNPIRGYSGSVTGIIGLNADRDLFRINVSSTGTYNFNLTTPAFGNLDGKLILYRVHENVPLVGIYYEMIATADPAVTSANPFANLGASFSMTLQPGKYGIVVQSHGSYGDLGQYTLRITQPSIYAYDSNMVTLAYASETSPTPTTPTMPVTKSNSGLEAKSNLAGAGSTTQSVKLLKMQDVNLAAPMAESSKVLIKAEKLRVIDDLFAKWE
jgi:hypothetical protein